MPESIYPNRLHGPNIRLLKLLPGKPEERLKCQLIETPLNNIPPFEALSYVWGDPSHRQIITCNGQDMSITVSLSQALQRLRPPRHTFDDAREENSSGQTRLDNDHPNGEPRMLWADAICINQEDVVERSSQVQIMKDIYSGASGVVVWLGADPEGLAKGAVAAIKTVCAYLSSYQQIIEELRNKESAPTWMKGRGRFTSDMCMMAFESHNIVHPWKSLQAFFSVPWWTRIWCVQEVYLAKQVKVCFGTEEIDGKSLAAFTTWYMRENHFETFSKSQTKRRMELEAAAVEAAHIISQDTPLSRAQLCLICEDFRGRQATDARDKVYGVLGLWQPRSVEYSIGVDYDKSTAVVYTNVILQAIKERKDLFVLRMVDHKPDYDFSEDDDFPSWVPRWDDGKGRQFVWLDKSPVRACRFLAEPPDEDLALAGVLRIKGHVFDRIAWVSDELEAGILSFYNYSAFRETVVRLYKEAIGTELNPTYSHQVSVVELATALTSGMIKIGLEFLDNDVADPNAYLDIADIDTEIGRQYINSFQTFMDTDDHPGDTSVFPRLLATIAGKRLFRTERGYVGLGRRSARIGDFVTVLHGGWVPYILRLNGESGYMTFVGDCFVHDIMNGQVYDMQEEGCMMKGIFEIH